MKFIDGFGWFLVLIFRGILLWALIPFSFLAWLVCHCWAQKASLRQAVSWYDFNLVAALANGPFRPLVVRSRRPEFIGISDMARVVPHRITGADLS